MDPFQVPRCRILSDPCPAFVVYTLSFFCAPSMRLFHVRRFVDRRESSSVATPFVGVPVGNTNRTEESSGLNPDPIPINEERIPFGDPQVLPRNHALYPAEDQ